MGTAVMMTAKIWFLDPMVWLFVEKKGHHDQYGRWLRRTHKAVVDRLPLRIDATEITKGTEK